MIHCKYTYLSIKVPPLPHSVYNKTEGLTYRQIKWKTIFSIIPLVTRLKLSNGNIILRNFRAWWKFNFKMSDSQSWQEVRIIKQEVLLWINGFYIKLPGLSHMKHNNSWRWWNIVNTALFQHSSNSITRSSSFHPSSNPCKLTKHCIAQLHDNDMRL